MSGSTDFDPRSDNFLSLTGEKEPDHFEIYTVWTLNPAPEEGTERWFRVWNKKSYSESYPAQIMVDAYRVISHTSKGVWLDVENYTFDKVTRKFVLRPNKKGEQHPQLAGQRYAYPTMAMAVASYVRRKQVHINRLKLQITRSEYALEVAMKWKDPTDAT